MSELYLFERGTTKYTYTNGLDSVSFGGDTYTPEIISYDRVNITNDVFRANIDLSLPIANTVVTVVMTLFTTDVTTLKIYRDESLWWAGRVTGVTIKTNAILHCESIYSSVKRLGVKTTFERLCRHTIFSTGCGLNKNDFDYTGNVTVINGKDITIPGIPGTDGYFKMGILYNGTTYTTILKRVTNVFTLIRYIALTVGQSVTLYPGCNHWVGPVSGTYGCSDYSNILNYGGFPKCPSSNIYEVGIV